MTSKFFASIIPSILLMSFIDTALALDLKREKRVAQTRGKISSLFERTKTVCVGRYMFDVPVNSTVVYGPASAPYHIERFPEDGSHFSAMVEVLAKDGLSKKSKFPIGPASGPGSKVGTIVPGFGENHKIIYGVESMTGAFYSIQSVVVVGKDIYVQEQSHYGDPSELDRLVEELKGIAARIVYRDQETVPNEAGVCIDGAFVLDSGHPHHERTTVGVRLTEFNDVHFSIDMTLKDRLYEDDALPHQLQAGEQNAKQSGIGDWYSRIKFLRRTERQISDWKGYEALVRRPPQKQFRSVHEFSFVSQGEPNNAMLPMVTIDLHTGVQGNTMGVGLPSLTDDEVTEVWDRLTQSIRPILTKQKLR